MNHFPLTLICVALIFVLSFFTPPQTPLDNVAFIDKWTHLVMYGGTVGMFWLEYWYAHWRKGYTLFTGVLIVLSLAIPIALGGVIEILQAYCTNGRRSGEWLDWVADSIGIVIACLLGYKPLGHLTRKLWQKDH